MHHVEQILENGILQCSFNRLELRNTITTAMYNTLAQVLEKIIH